MPRTVGASTVRDFMARDVRKVRGITVHSAPTSPMAPELLIPLTLLMLVLAGVMLFSGIRTILILRKEYREERRRREARLYEFRRHLVQPREP